MSKAQENDIGGFQNFVAGLEPSEARHSMLLEDGRSWSDIHSDLLARKNGDYDWRRGRIPLYVYHDNDQLLEVSREAYNLYFSENALGGRAFPSLARMEREVVQMALSLFSAPEGSDGSFTSGGTESIFLAMKAAREFFRTIHSSVPKPRVIVPRTAHPAFDKAAHYLDVDIVRTDVSEDLRGNVSELQSAIDRRTMMIAGSAPCYPYGVYDPIRPLGEIALSKRIWLHVDACLGGFLAPFARDEGYAVPEFDFSIPGVTSLSADLHKYGFSAKGASILMYCSSSLKSYQIFKFKDWPRGTYATETFLGSRPGGAIASAWAVSQFLGRRGYCRLARKTMEAKQYLVRGIEGIRGLEVVRPSDLSIVLYRSIDEAVDINAVAEILGKRGWFVGRTRSPQALHLALNAVHAPIIGEYLRDLEVAVQEARMTCRIGELDDMTY